MLEESLARQPLMLLEERLQFGRQGGILLSQAVQPGDPLLRPQRQRLIQVGAQRLPAFRTECGVQVWDCRSGKG